MTYEQKVKRVYPSATCLDVIIEGNPTEYLILPNNGSGNTIGASLLDPLDAWKRAAAAIEPPRKAKR